VYFQRKGTQKYEFGNKVSILRTQKTSIIVGAMSFRNSYDGHTLPDALKQYERLTGIKATTATADRGYRGQTEIGGAKTARGKRF
jgi:IS5 family transposase